MLSDTDPDSFWFKDLKYLLSFFEGIMRSRGPEAEKAMDDLYEKSRPKPKKVAVSRDDPERQARAARMMMLGGK